MGANMLLAVCRVPETVSAAEIEALKGRMPAGFRRIGGLVFFQYDTSDVELGRAKQQAAGLREEKDERDWRPRYLGVRVVNKAPETRDGGRVVRFGRVFVARPEETPESREEIEDEDERAYEDPLRGVWQRRRRSVPQDLR